MRSARAWTPDFALKLMVIPPALFLLPTFVAPLALVLYRGFGGAEPSLANFQMILSNATYSQVLLQTFQTAALSTLLALIIGFPIAHVISGARPIWANITFALVMIPFWTSVVSRTYAWIALLGRRGLINNVLIDSGWIDQPLKLMYNALGVQIGMVQILLPMMILPLVSNMRQIDRTKLLAAAVLGADPIRAFLHIYLPMCFPGIVAGSVLVFITALGFYVTPALLGGDRDMMISVLIEQQVTQTLNWPLASALATILLIMVILCLWSVAMLARGKVARLERS